MGVTIAKKQEFGERVTILFYCVLVLQNRHLQVYKEGSKEVPIKQNMIMAGYIIVH